jgi:transcriptional regulator with XRE-family HTH domain
MSNKIDKISPLGKKILKALEDQRLRKKDIYDRMGISRGTLDNWISGATAPDHDKLEQMFRILDIKQEGQAQPFKHLIFEGDYVGLHKRAWDQLEETLAQNRELLTSVAGNNNQLVISNSQLADTLSKLVNNLTKASSDKQR